MKLVQTSVKRPVGVIMIVLAIIALGVVSVRSLAIDLFPKIELPIAVVATSYPDAAPEDVEELISRPIEGSVSSIEGIDTIQSQSQPGASLVVMMFKNGTDLDQALLDVREKIDQTKGFLPEQANEPSIIRFNPDQLPLMWVSLTGKEAAELTSIAEDQVVPYLERQGGVASVNIEGAKTREIQIELNETAMQQYGVTAQTITQSLNSTNQSSSVGVVEKGSKNLQLRVVGEFTSVDDIKQTIVQSETGATIQVDDVADVKDTFKKSSSETLVNGKSSVVLSIMKKTDGNPVDVAGNVKDAISDMKGDLSSDVDLDVVIDTSEFIELSINSVVQNILIGGIISIFILLLFLKSIRATLVIGVSIPIAIISTFTLMYFTGETLNVLTLGGLALGLGMMVDSSIVILEHIYTYRQRGYSLKEAAINGASELAPAVIASTTTTLVVFLPIIYVEGIASDLFTPLALAVSFALITSLIAAITLVPMLSSKLLASAMGEEGRRYWFNRFLDKVGNLYQRMLKWVLKFRKITVAATLAIIVGSLALIPMIGAEFIPSADQGQVQISVKTASGTSLEDTEDVVEQINDKITDYESLIETNFVTVGGGDQMGGGAGGSGNTASYMIQLLPASDRDQSTSQVVADIDEDLQGIAGAEITVSTMDGGMSTGDPIQIQLHGPEHGVLRDLSEDVIDELNQIDGVHNPESSASEGLPQMTIKVDESAAAAYGLNQQQITGQVQMKLNGQTATQYREGGEEINVVMKYPEENNRTISDLLDLKIQSPSGAVIPLQEVADLTQTQGPATLTRQNQRPQLNITSGVMDRDLGSVVDDVKKTLNDMPFPEGYDFDIGGQAQDMQESFQDLALALVFSIFLVYAVMAVQFENFLFPFIIMFAMPTTVVGVLLGLFITGIPLSIPGFIGIIMLAGIVVNNSIVLVDYINILRRKGMERYEAILEAGRSRLRPILMTTLTTVLAMVPLALALGEGSETQQPLAVTIIFGLSVSSLFTLLLVPVIYSFFDDFTAKVTRRNKRKKNV
ncbi:Multidrug resistance protein MexB [Lentibacillus sp. JNUCC-1]|uniref:efflux RND transporter permease subunit n=1 Tax=Lentibacillus sp. JNUCC-1 TaxID=2654513 RepID=UPI0013272435|nr:Multidrug resistance protein MexB [Lentibacillus sp. JNUCC-1]